MTATLCLEVMTRGDQLVPRLVYEYATPPDRAEGNAIMHDLTARAWRASKGQGWDVLPVMGLNARTGTVFTGCELVLDSHTFDAAFKGRGVLELVQHELERQP